MRQKHHRLHTKDEFAAMKLIEANGQRDGDNWIYNEGWSDQRVAATIGGSATVYNIRNRRRDVFGALPKATHNGKNTIPRLKTLEADINTLLSDLANSQGDISALTRRVDQLEKALNTLLSAPTRDAMYERIKVVNNQFKPSSEMIMTQHASLPVSGYTPQRQEAVDVVNINKAKEEEVLRLLDALASHPDIDQRWLAIGRTAIEQGFMAVNRAVFRPGRVILLGDARS